MLQDDANPSRQMIDYSDAVNLGSAIGFFAYISKDSIVPSANSFNNVLLVGNIVSNPKENLIREYLFVDESNTFKFKLGVVPKQKGVFGVLFSNAANVYRKSDKCTKAGFTINFQNTNQHVYLLPAQPQDPTIPSGAYFMKVY